MKFSSNLLLLFISKTSVHSFVPSILLTSIGSRRTSLSLSSTATTIETTTLPKQIKRAWGIEPQLSTFPEASFPLGLDDESAPPILELPHFLSPQECKFILDWASQAIESGTDECDDYLNARVNNEVETKGTSDEGRALIEECHLTEVELSASHRGGFRIRLDRNIIEVLLKKRLLAVLGMPNRMFVFEHGAWIRPTPRTVIVRDQTVVHYAGGNGVPPHVDGKDGTLLVYLSDVAEGVGGRTVFPEDGFSQVPVEGTALLYRSKTELLHYSEAMMGTNEKWVLQLLLDYNHDYQPGDTVVDFRTGETYVWDGK